MVYLIVFLDAENFIRVYSSKVRNAIHMCSVYFYVCMKKEKGYRYNLGT